MSTLKDLISDQEQIRTRLLEMMKAKPRSIMSFAKEIGVANQTLAQFLRGNTKINSKIATIMQNYIEKHDNENILIN